MYFQNLKTTEVKYSPRLFQFWCKSQGQWFSNLTVLLGKKKKRLYDRLSSGSHPCLDKSNEVLWRGSQTSLFFKSSWELRLHGWIENCYGKSNRKWCVLGVLKLSVIHADIKLSKITSRIVEWLFGITSAETIINFALGEIYIFWFALNPKDHNSIL